MRVFPPGQPQKALTDIMNAATMLCPEILRLEMLRTWAGLRPVTPDGLPVIGPDPDVKGLWYTTGHGRNGILFAGLTGVIIKQLLAGGATHEAVKAFSPGRFFDS